MDRQRRLSRSGSFTAGIDVTSGQLALVDVPAVPKLTDRQRRAFDLITSAGWDGLSSDELGAHFHRHGPEQRCMWCCSTGNDLGRALRAKGLAQQRRRRAPGGDLYSVWTIVGRLVPSVESGRLVSAYNEFPEGF